MRRSGASFSGEFVLNKTAMAMAGDVEVMVPLEGLVDPKAELAELEKDQVKMQGDSTTCKASSPTRTSSRARRPRCSTRTGRGWPSSKPALAKIDDRDRAPRSKARGSAYSVDGGIGASLGGHGRRLIWRSPRRAWPFVCALLGLRLRPAFF